MIRAHRVTATARDDASMLSGWNIAPNVAYTLRLLPGPAFCGVLLYNEANALLATGAAIVGTEQPCVLAPQSGQTISMVDAELGWHLLLTTTGTESQRTIRIGPAVDLPDEIHPIYADDEMALARATAAIDDAAHYRDDVTVACPNDLVAWMASIVSVPEAGVSVVGQVESSTWTATPDGTSEQVVIRRHVAIAPEAFVEPTPIIPPVVADDSGATDAVTAISGNVLINGEPGLTVVAVNGLSASVGVAVDGTNGGVFTIAASGTWVFEPDGDFAALTGSETADTSVTYYASDGAAEAMATLTITVSGTATVLWTPAEIPGAIVFDVLDSTGIMLNGGTVSAWADMLGSGIAAVQATPSAQPTLVDGELVFDGGDVLTIAGSSSAAWCKALHSTGGTVVTLNRYGVTSNPGAAYCLFGTAAASGTNVGVSVYYEDRAVAANSNDAQSFLIGNGSIYQNAAYFINPNKAPNFDNIVPANVDHILAMTFRPQFSPATQRFLLSVDGGAEITGNLSNSASRSTANARYDFDIGAGGNGVIKLVGSIKSMAIIPSILSLDDKLKLQGWMAHRHSRTSLLPSDHPYKSTPPAI